MSECGGAWSIIFLKLNLLRDCFTKFMVVCLIIHSIFSFPTDDGLQGAVDMNRLSRWGVRAFGFLVFVSLSLSLSLSFSRASVFSGMALTSSVGKYIFSFSFSNHLCRHLEQLDH